jgi:hypothetical protein
MFHQTRTTGLEDQQDSILSDIATALVPITAAAWQAAQHFSYGARGFMRVPVSEANDLNYLLYAYSVSTNTRSSWRIYKLFSTLLWQYKPSFCTEVLNWISNLFRWFMVSTTTPVSPISSQ